jgi:hypothetical protein
MHDESVYDDQTHNPPGSSPEVVYGRASIHGLDYTGEQCTVPKLESDCSNLHQYLFSTISLFDSCRIRLFAPFRIETAYGSRVPASPRETMLAETCGSSFRERQHPCLTEASSLKADSPRRIRRE